MWTVAVVFATVGTVRLWRAMPSDQLTQAVEFGSLEGLERRVKLKFPPGTALRMSLWDGFMDPCVVAKLEIPRSSLDAFLRDPPFSGATTKERLVWDQTCVRLRLEQLSEWHPDQAQHFISAQGDGICLLADLDDPKRVVVYLECRS